MTQLLLQGTTNMSAKQLADELDKYAIEFSVDLKQDYLRFRFTCLNEDFEKSLEIMADIIKNTTFEEFDKEVAKARGEITAKLDSPRLMVVDKYYATLFENHPYGNTSSKVLENLDKFTKEDVIEAYKMIKHTSKKVCSFVGDLDFYDVQAKLNDKFFDLEKSSDFANETEPPFLAEGKYAEVIKSDANQAHILRGWLTGSYLSEDYASLSLLNIILGASGLSSRLFCELRDKKGLAYVVRSSYEPLMLCGNFSIYIATEPKNIEVSLKGFEEEIKKIQEELVSVEELENAKNNLFGKLAFILETNAQQASTLAHYGIFGIGFDFLDRIKEKIKAVTPEDIKRCAIKNFTDISTTAILKP
jgi:predicted Zn-dependent peptidase